MSRLSQIESSTQVADHPESSRVISRQEATTSFASSSPLIIVVDDDEPFRDGIRERLQSHGYEVIAVNCAKRAYELLLENHSRRILMVTDLVMEGEGGWSLAQTARSRFPDLPIIFMSGVIEEPVIHAAIARGNSVFLAKPFFLDTLVENIGVLLAK